MHLEQHVSKSKWEIPFQIGLHIIVFVFYSFNSNSPHFQETLQIQVYQIVFFLNYAIAALIIGYLLFPNYLYKKKYWHFFIAVILLVTVVIIMEEFVLEKIYFPDKRGKYFRGVFFSLLDVLPVMIILCGFKLAWDIILKQRQVEELKASVEESELRFLKSQINPHFLFNNLNNLYSHALENSPKTPEIILEMSSLLRYMLYECRKEFVSLDNELKQLENFIRLYEMQIEGRGRVHLSEKGASGSNLPIAPLILIVFVENAFKHSAANQDDIIKIDIAVELIGNQLVFKCENTCEYGAHSEEDQNRGIGLQNVKKRLAYIYPKSHDLQIESTDDHYRVELKIDLTATK